MYVGEGKDLSPTDKLRKTGQSSHNAHSTYSKSTETTSNRINAAILYNYYDGPLPNPAATEKDYKARYKEWKSAISNDKFDEAVGIQWEVCNKRKYNGEYEEAVHDPSFFQYDEDSDDGRKAAKHPFLERGHVTKGKTLDYQEYISQKGGLVDVSCGLFITATSARDEMEKGQSNVDQPPMADKCVGE